MDHLDSPQLRMAARRYAEAARRAAAAPFWRRKNISVDLTEQRRAYVRELIRAAETRRLEV